MKKEITRFIKNVLLFSLFALTFYVVAICVAGDFFPKKINKKVRLK